MVHSNTEVCGTSRDDLDPLLEMLNFALRALVEEVDGRRQVAHRRVSCDRLAWLLRTLLTLNVRLFPGPARGHSPFCQQEELQSDRTQCLCLCG